MDTKGKSSKQATEFRQAALVDAVLRLAARRNPSGITTGDLAQAVGITQGAVFRHFDSKEAIWLATMAWVTRTLMAQLHTAAGLDGDDAQATPPNALAALRAVFMAHVDFVTQHPGVSRIIFQELQQPQDTAVKASVRQLMQQYRSLVVRLLNLAKLNNLIAASADVQSASVLFLGSIQGLVMQSLTSGDVASMAPQAAGVFAIFERGLRADYQIYPQGTP
jgi:AcrR family transcriptional regulator